MKITIEPETEEEKKQRDTVVIENVVEFAFAGRTYTGLAYADIQHSHVADKFRLAGDLEQLKLRILHGIAH